ncbi:MAG: chemotaxis signal transduction protein [Proteobacteria bacterium]|nr:chemotaxis signal transduction protein [Pseudomonadota bacterium]
MPPESQDKITADIHEYLVFLLGEESYAINILCVREIRAYDSVTAIPNAPEFIKGVINLRGDIVPIYDLRIRFRCSSVDYGVLTTVIILAIGSRIVGVVVDGVSNVIMLANTDIYPSPDFSASFDTSYIKGLAEIEGRTCIIADILSLMSSPDLDTRADCQP